MDKIIEGLNILNQERIALESEGQSMTLNAIYRDRAQFKAAVLKEQIEQIAEAFDMCLCASCDEVGSRRFYYDGICQDCRDEDGRLRDSIKYDYYTR